MESVDNKNVMCVFGTGGDDRQEGPVVLPDNVARLRRMFRSHTRLRHYLTTVPYRRALHRLARRRTENRMLSELPTIEAVLDWGRRLVREP